MKIKIALLAAILLLAATMNIEGTYMGAVGNLCEKTDKNPSGYCYEELPKKGFPIAWIRSHGMRSPTPNLDPSDIVPARFILAIIVNAFMYFVIAYLVVYFLSKIIFRKNKL